MPGTPYNSHTNDIFYKFGILKIKDVYNFNMCLFMFKQLEIGNFTIEHSLNTRNRKLAAPRFCRLTHSQQSISDSVAFVK